MKHETSLKTAQDILEKCFLVSPQEVGPDDRLEGRAVIDSLSIELLRMELEEATGKDIEIEKIMNCSTTNHFAKLIEEVGA